MKFHLRRIVLLTALFTLMAGAVSAQANSPEPLYRVAFVEEDDVLNVRSGAGAANRIAGTLPPDATDISITGAGRQVGRSLWMPMRQGDIRGWVNRYYLTEQVDSETFCEDSAALDLIEDLKTAIADRDGDQLAALVSPVRGLLLRHNRWNPEVRLSRDEAANFFADTMQRAWGTYDGSGDPIQGSSAEIILPLLNRDLLPSEIAGCDEVVGGPTTGLLQLPFEYSAVHHFSLFRPAPDEFNAFDWGTWVVGIEYWDGLPAISYLVHYRWEI